MATLLGDREVELTNKVFKKEQGAALKVGKPTSAGTVETIEWWFQGSTGNQTVDVGIYEDEAGKPGKLLAHKATFVTQLTEKETWIVVPGFTVAVEPGKEYWLAILNENLTEPKYRYKKEAGHEVVRTTTLAGLELKEGNTWTALAESANMSIAAIGTETGGGAVTGKASGTILLTGKATGVAAQKVEGKATGPLLLTGTATGLAVQVVTGSASGAVLLTGTSKGRVAGALVGKASGAILLKGAATGIAAQRVAGKATGTIRLTGTATGIAANRVTAKAAGTLLLTGTATGTAGASITAKASGALILTGSATANSAGGVLPNHPGVVNPGSRSGVVTPKVLAGLVNPAERQGNG